MRILVADASFLPHRSDAQGAGPVDAQWTWLQGPNDPKINDLLPTADVFASGLVTESHLQLAKNLQVLQITGAGFDRVALEAVPENVAVATSGHHAGPMAEYIAGSLIALRRDFLGQDRALRQGQWKSHVYNSQIPQHRSLAGSTVTFLGFGEIGQAAWNILRQLGMRGIAITRRGLVGDQYSDLSWSGATDLLGTALEESDALVISVPLSAQTHQLITKEHLALLGPEGVIINVARGPIIQEQDLYEALSSGIIGGAALDVWWNYPQDGDCGEPSQYPLSEFPNVLMTPHCSGITEDIFRSRAIDLGLNVDRFTQGLSLLRPMQRLRN